MNITEIREKRNGLWESMKSFLDSRRQADGTLSFEDDGIYAKMEKDLDALTNEIHRMERQAAIEAELNN